MHKISDKTHEIKYTIHKVASSYLTHSHVIIKETNKSLCGKDATRWNKADWTTTREVKCLRCKRVMGEAI
jgi:hypothetical protein